MAVSTATPASAGQRLLGFFGLGGGGGGGGGSPSREDELAEQLESRDAEAVALQVELANLKSALRSQEQQVALNHRLLTADRSGLPAPALPQPYG